MLNVTRITIPSTREHFEHAIGEAPVLMVPTSSTGSSSTMVSRTMQRFFPWHGELRKADDPIISLVPKPLNGSRHP